MTQTLTNADFSKADVKFTTACKLASIPSTTRQASKFRMGRGLAWEVTKNKGFTDEVLRVVEARNQKIIDSLSF